MRGTLYGIGVGRGKCGTDDVKGSEMSESLSGTGNSTERKERCTAYQIAVQAVPEIKEKKSCALTFQ